MMLDATCTEGCAVIREFEGREGGAEAAMMLTMARRAIRAGAAPEIRPWISKAHNSRP